MTDRRLAILGWDDRVRPLLAPLEAYAGLCVAGVGDRGGTALVRARGATGAPCFQHPAEMLRRLDYDALLVASAEADAELAGTAAARGADLIALGDVLPGAALEAVATAAVRHGVALAIVRPLLRGAGFEAVADLLAETSPAELLSIEVHDQRPSQAILRDAVALALRTLQATPQRVTAAASGPAVEGIAAQLRDAGGGLATLAAVSGPRLLRVHASGEAGAIELEASAGGIELTEHSRDGATTTRRLDDADPATVEAEHVARALDGDATDLRFAHREAAVLGALESALATGQTHRVAEPGVRATLQLLEGGGAAPTPRAGHLHVLPAGRAS
jgi:hypothetical protein